MTDSGSGGWLPVLMLGAERGSPQVAQWRRAASARHGAARNKTRYTYNCPHLDNRTLLHGDVLCKVMTNVLKITNYTTVV